MTDPEPQDLLLALAVSPNFKQDALLFAGRRSGLYRSTDAGCSWLPQDIIAGSALSVTALAFSPDFARDRAVFAALPGGVAYSQDGGHTWFWTQFPTPAPYIPALIISPNFAADHTLFAATLEDGVLRSVDGGVSWQSWNFGLLDQQVFCLAMGGEALHAGTGSGLFRSLNGGRSWREVPLPVQDSILSLAVLDGRFLAGTEEHGLYISSDEGLSWTQVQAAGMEAPINQLQAAAGQPGCMRALAGSRLMESNPDGQAWREIQLPARDGQPILLAGLFVGFPDGQVLACPAV